VPYKSGELVRHRNKPEWGIGRVAGQTGEGKVLVKFTGRKGDVLLTAAAAEQFLATDADGTWQSTARVANPVQTAPRLTPCITCAKDLREVLSSPDGEWRSCPQDSSRNGRQHVFLRYPAAFDVEADAAAAEDDPQRGWCKDCRAGRASSGFKMCNLVMR
jgi:hypothetical protein